MHTLSTGVAPVTYGGLRAVAAGCLAAALAGLAVPATVSAQNPFDLSGPGWTLVDDFSGLTLGPLNGQNNWVVSQTDAAVTVAVDPGNPGNQLLQVGDGVTTGNKTIYNAAAITHSANNPASLYFRFMTAPDVTTATADISAGLTIQDPPGNNFNFQAQVRVRGNADRNPPQLDARDGGMFLGDGQTEPPIDPEFFALTAGVWYDLWIGHNHPNDRYNVFIQGPGDTEPILLFDDLVYRVASDGNPLNAIFIRTGGGGGNLGPFYIDDVWFNSMVSVPEPSTYALAGLGGLMLLLMGRRRFRR